MQRRFLTCLLSVFLLLMQHETLRHALDQYRRAAGAHRSFDAGATHGRSLRRMRFARGRCGLDSVGVSAHGGQCGP
jgi:hypothetical protein